MKSSAHPASIHHQASSAHPGHCCCQYVPSSVQDPSSCLAKLACLAKHISSASCWLLAKRGENKKQPDGRLLKPGGQGEPFTQPWRCDPPQREEEMPKMFEMTAEKMDLKATPGCCCCSMWQSTCTSSSCPHTSMVLLSHSRLDTGKPLEVCKYKCSINPNTW